jgi:hypothetical protein
MRFLKRPPTRKLSLRRRWLGLTSMMRIQRAKLEKVNISASEQTNFKYFLPLIASSMCSQIIVVLLRINRHLRNVAKRRTMLRLKRTVLMLLVLRHKIVAPPRELNSKLSKINYHISCSLICVPFFSLCSPQFHLSRKGSIGYFIIHILFPFSNF